SDLSGRPHPAAATGVPAARRAHRHRVRHPRRPVPGAGLGPPGVPGRLRICVRPTAGSPRLLPGRRPARGRPGGARPLPGRRQPHRPGLLRTHRRPHPLERRPTMRSTLGVLGVAAALVLCCAAPVLIAAGGLGLFGAAAANPYLIGAALLILATGGWFVWSRRRRSADADCCPPPSAPHHKDPYQ